MDINTGPQQNSIYPAVNLVKRGVCRCGVEMPLGPYTLWTEGEVQGLGQRVQ
jgi:hypothetical protein